MWKKIESKEAELDLKLKDKLFYRPELGEQINLLVHGSDLREPSTEATSSYRSNVENRSKVKHGRKQEIESQVTFEKE